MGKGGQILIASGALPCCEAEQGEQAAGLALQRSAAGAHKPGLGLLA